MSHDEHALRKFRELGLLPKTWSVNADDNWFRLGPTPPGVQRFDKGDEDSVLLVRVTGEHQGVDWILLEWCGRTPGKDDHHYDVPAHGWGTGHGLREPRHTYFGQDGDGYVHYLDFDSLTWAIGILRQWMDF